MPHMHLRGKDFKYTVVYPDGKQDVLLNVPKYDFNWQLSYELKDRLKLPKGTRIDCVAHFDNSANNQYNPDPTKEVRWGDQTWEEMMIGWFTYTVAAAAAQRASLQYKLSRHPPGPSQETAAGQNAGSIRTGRNSRS